MKSSEVVAPPSSIEAVRPEDVPTIEAWAARQRAELVRLRLALRAAVVDTAAPPIDEVMRTGIARLERRLAEAEAEAARCVEDARQASEELVAAARDGDSRSADVMDLLGADVAGRESAKVYELFWQGAPADRSLRRRLSRSRSVHPA